MVQGRSGVNFVHYSSGPDKEDLVLLAITSNRQLVLVIWQLFPLLGHLRFMHGLLSYS